jgi:hypothetical protein
LLGAFGFAIIAAFAAASRQSATEPGRSGSVQVTRGESGSSGPLRDEALVVEHKTVGNLMLYLTDRTILT